MMNTNWIYALRVSGRSFIEDAKEAGTVSLLGMVAIFAVLALLWFLIELLHRALAEKNEPSDVDEVQATQPKDVESAPTPVAESAPVAAADDGALIAAITAAISAAMAEDGYTGGFRVVSFKRASVRKNGRG